MCSIGNRCGHAVESRKRRIASQNAKNRWHGGCNAWGTCKGSVKMTKLIPASAGTARKNTEAGSLLGYVIKSGVFLLGVVGLFALAGFTL
jgi:hypothetical protein